MKKYIAIALLMVLGTVYPAYARWSVGAAGGGVAAATGDSCTGGLLLSAHFENSDTITAGTPTGCSAGDTIWALTNATYTATNAQDGTYALLLDDNNDKAVLSITSRDVIDERNGRVDFYLYADNVSSGSSIFRAEYGAEDYISVYRSGTEIAGRYNSTTGGSITATTSGLGLTNGTSYHIIFKWRSGTENPSIHLTVNASTAEATSDLTAMAGTPTTLTLGDTGGWAFRSKIDNLKIYNSYE